MTKTILWILFLSFIISVLLSGIILIVVFSIYSSPLPLYVIILCEVAGICSGLISFFLANEIVEKYDL